MACAARRPNTEEAIRASPPSNTRLHTNPFLSPPFDQLKQFNVMKPRLFIGSSSEALPIAKKMREILIDDVDIYIWNQTFNLGDNTLDSLRRQVLLSDFALLVVTPDDPVSKRERDGYSARDNVLFELGLFMGLLGPRKCFFLVVTDKRKGAVKEVFTPSDLDGITWLSLEIGDEDYEAALRERCDMLLAAINRTSRSLELSLLPSTSLAIGYFNNFILHVCNAFSNASAFEVGDQTFDLTNYAYDFTIVLPNPPNNASQQGYRKFARKRKLVEVKIDGANGARPFPFFVSSTIENGRLQMFDYPTTLKAAYDAIEIAGDGDLSEEEQSDLEQRETRNFESTLRKLLKDSEAAEFCDNIHIISESELPAV
jgi:Predicted nucleotide-binding protein containing TIR-like domain